MADTDPTPDVWITERISPADIYAHGVYEVLAAAKTPYQSMQIVRSGIYGTALVLDGLWQSCTGDEFCYHEPLVQPAMIARTLLAGRPPKTALVLGGGEGATSREILRWDSVERCVMVDIDGEVVEACKVHLAEMHRGAFDDPRHAVHVGDAFAYIDDEAARPEGGWDLIVSDLSDPIEDGPSFRLFTRDYFAQLKAALAPDGVLAVQAGPVSPPECTQHARLNRTLRDVFAHAASLSGPTCAYGRPWGFVVASDLAVGSPEATAPDAARVDALLAERCRPFPGEEAFGGTGLRVVDGPSLAGLYALPRFLRQKIEHETTVYTLDAPPRFEDHA